MSVRSFISAELYLNSFGITIQQAQEFISLNIKDPRTIFEVAYEYGVTTAMLSEITDYPKDIVKEYFNTINKDGKSLDGKSILVNSDLGSLEQLVNFNSKTDILSNVALRDGVQKILLRDENEQNPPFSLFYDPTFMPEGRDRQKNGSYDAEELGVGNLGTVSATNESLESLFYGSLINMFSAIDESEWNQITALRTADDSTEGYYGLLLTSLQSPSSMVWSDEKMAMMVQDEASYIIEKHWTHGEVLVGILDHSFLGLATA
ncbi:hypothetical protein C8R34_11298 [Nitrosomonas sp. Nm84]|uniref:hypothetical protein n=1 Tax=Nitrosomonas sp. Nm84 TaxID=200124 RepID=UPI000D754F5C|nr:hypothetical protein [Nitrosomonas sp. Nm84]PXW86934.1 hypothetical protein C8R34_11298 [Nitrosomonas sp. Nm84]